MTRWVVLVSGAFLIAAAPPAFDGIPHLRFVYRPIAGATIAELHASLEASALHPPGGGSSYAHTENHIDWHWQGRGATRSDCRVAKVDVDFRADVHLPRLVDPDALEPDVVTPWHRFSEAIALHEAGHARMAWVRLPRIRAAILGQPCDRADAAGRAAVAALNSDQAAYDRATRHGAAQGAHFP